MASPTSLDVPPAQPPTVQAGGPAPMAGVGAMMADKAKAGMDGKGMAVAIWETAKKALNRLSEMNQDLAPFVARGIAVIDAGFEKLGQGKPGTQSADAQPETSPAGSSAPGGVGPGQGFPG